MFISYAHNGEDVWLNRVFEGKNDGFYIDVGAQNHKIGSCSYAFSECGWSGINICLDSNSVECVRKARAKDLTVLYKGGVHSLEAYIDRCVDDLSFVCIAESSIAHSIIQSTDWKECRPIVLIVKAVSSPIRDIVGQQIHALWHTWEPLLMDAGYVFATFDGLNRYYVRKEDQNLVAKFIIPISRIVDNYKKFDVDQSLENTTIGSGFFKLSHPELDNAISFYVSDTNVSRDAIASGIRREENFWLNEAVMATNFSDGKGAFIDIGANLGLWSFVFASKGHNVYGFEGSSLNHAQLLKTNEQNSFNCNFLCIGISDCTGVYKFVSEGPYGHLSNEFIDKDGDPIFCISIDDWYVHSKIREHVSFIKLDIEGSELKALKGMKQFLEDKKFPPIFAESNAWCLAWNKTLPSDLLSAFREIGYTPYKIINSQVLAKVTSDIQMNVVENYLFIHSSSTLIKNKKIVDDTENGIDGFLRSVELLSEQIDSPGFEHISYAMAYQIINQPELHKGELVDNFMKIFSKTKDKYNRNAQLAIKLLLQRIK